MFAIYMDVLMVRLRSSGFGCCVCVVYFGCLMFADDTLLTHSVLSRLRDIAYVDDVIYAVDYDTNSSKSLLHVLTVAMMRCVRADELAGDLCYIS